ncbi:hypothetical protein B0J18DRAFT_462130 [Chaetomium sp. MPI-SDFR-AT-0129]|nr:hypothetical protein B0J18DRAFT_462130 [Chaetomium sp. MPI-SDFR-AT-0129]
MSNNSSSSNRNWNDLLKHGSALGILKPDVAFPPYGGSTTSGTGASGGSGSGSASGSGGQSGSSYPAGGQTSRK